MAKIAFINNDSSNEAVVVWVDRGLKGGKLDEIRLTRDLAIGTAARLLECALRLPREVA